MTSRWLVCVFALVLGCSESGGTSGDGGTAGRPGGDGGTAGTGGEGGTGAYADKDLWLCRPDIEEDYCDTADLSTADAFEYYMSNHSAGRDILLIGSSQGSHMLTRLLEEKFDGDQTLRGQLISALLMGMTRLLYVPAGELIGGNLQNIPLCSGQSETGCVVAYEPWADLSDTGEKIVVPPGSADACVNPASADDSSLKVTMKAFWFDRVAAGESFPEDVATNWGYMPGLLASQCVGSRLVLSKADADDPRAGVDFPRSFARADRNLHSFSVASAAADLIDLIDEQASAR